MKEFLRTVLAVLVAMFILIFIIFMVGYSKSFHKAEVQSGSYLVLDVSGEIVDYAVPGVASQVFGGGAASQSTLLENLEKAVADDRIKGVILKIDNSTLGFAKLGELRDAVGRVKEKGKKVYAYSEFLSNRPYYLAAACDSIFMPPSGYVELKGWANGAMFVKGTLDKLGIEPNIHKIAAYKSAAEMVTREDMSEASKEETTWLMNGIYADYITAIASDRSMSPGQFESAYEKALFLPEEAAAAGFVDGVLYWDQLETRLKEPDDKKLKTVSGSEYSKVKRADVGLKGKKIAIVHAQGLIHSGTSGVDPILGMTMGAKSVIKDLREVLEDKDIVAVVFRVDSPGGSGLASDDIGRWVAVLDGNKPVVVSMADVAASGGYMVSDRIRPIVAGPNTITGSIGSITGKFNMHGLYDKIGVTYDFVAKGNNALINSDYQNWTDEQAKIVADNHLKGFELWEKSIAEHRGMTLEQVNAVAGGRVWTGRQALDRNLVDKLGGLYTALAAVKEKAQIPAGENVTIVNYPLKKSLFEALTSGELVTTLKNSLVFKARSYLLQWVFEAQSGWYVMPYIYTQQ